MIILTIAVIFAIVLVWFTGMSIFLDQTEPVPVRLAGLFATMISIAVPIAGVTTGWIG
jgi:hypothetical protein